MPKIRSASDIADKWKRVTPGRTEDYRLGVENPKKDWADETKKAESTYKEAITKSLAEGRFGKGVDAAGTEKWKDGAILKGIPRWGQGVEFGIENYEKGFAPYRDVIERTTLPKRYPKGDPRNYERVKAIGSALHKEKVG